MVAQIGRELLLKVESTPGGGTYTNVAGGMTVGIKGNSEAVEVTNKDSGGVRTLLEGAGVISYSVSMSGIFQDVASHQVVRTAFRTQDHINFKVVIPAATNDEVYTGLWQITDYEETGGHNDAVAFTLTLESAGTITVGAT